MKALSLRPEGDRIYIVGNTYHLRERLARELDACFDRARRAMWCRPDRRAQATAIIEEVNAAGGNDLHQESAHGIALYHGQAHLVLWYGITRRAGVYKFRLCDLQAAKASWHGPEITSWVHRFVRPVPVRRLLGEIDPPEDAPTCAICGQHRGVAQVQDPNAAPTWWCRACLLGEHGVGRHD